MLSSNVRNCTPLYPPGTRFIWAKKGMEICTYSTLLTYSQAYCCIIQYTYTSIFSCFASLFYLEADIVYLWVKEDNSQLATESASVHIYCAIDRSADSVDNCDLGCINILFLVFVVSSLPSYITSFVDPNPDSKDPFH